MAYIPTEAEEAIRINGHHPMRDMFGNVRPVVCSFLETKIHNNGRTANGGGSTLRGMPREDRAFGARADAPDDNDDNFDPFTDWQSSAPVVYPDNIDKMDSRTAYLIGRSHGQKEQFENLNPAIDAAIERVSNAYRS